MIRNQDSKLLQNSYNLSLLDSKNFENDQPLLQTP